MAFASAASPAVAGGHRGHHLGAVFPAGAHPGAGLRPRQQEQHAEDIGDSDEEKLTQTQGGGAVSLTYTTQVSISLSSGQATLYFANPSKSNQDIVLQIVAQDVVLAQSGTISPGKQVETLELWEGVAAQLSPGGYNGRFVVLYYQPDTHEKTIVNTEIPVNITVEP